MKRIYMNDCCADCVYLDWDSEKNNRYWCSKSGWGGEYVSSGSSACASFEDKNE